VGDGLVLYTDGVLDAGAPARTLTPRDLVALLAGAGWGSPQEMADAIHEAAVGDGAARDDIAILALRVTSAPPADSGAPGAPAAAAPAGRA
jgi:serine phosphatase RsbU (regulator of sigma subunit)